MFAGFRKSGVAWATLLVGCLLGALAIPRVLVALNALPAASAIFDIEQGASPSDEELIRAEQNLKRAIAYGVETANSNSQLSYLALYRQMRHPLAEGTLAELQDTRQQVGDALRRRPLDAFLWTRYAHVSYLFEGLSPYTLAALQRSFQYGSDEMELFRFRMILCLNEWENLPASLRKLVRDQIAFASTKQYVWSRLLVDISEEEASQQLLELLDEASLDIGLIKRHADWLRRKRGLENSGSATAE